MHYGLKTIALKNLVSIQQGLKVYIKDRKCKYAELIQSLLGFEEPLKPEHNRIFISSRKFFVEVQSNWRSKKLDAQKVKEDQLNNIHNGGLCGIFDIIEHTIKAFEKSQNQQVLDGFVAMILPDGVVSEDQPLDETTRAKLRLDFIVMRLVARLVKLGKDIKYIFEFLDKEKTGQSKDD